MTIKQQAVHCRPVRSDFNNNILHVSINIGHAIKKFKWKCAAMLCNIKNYSMILVRRFNHFIDRCHKN